MSNQAKKETRNVMRKKITAFALALCLLCAILPGSAFAGRGDGYVYVDIYYRHKGGSDDDWRAFIEDFLESHKDKPDAFVLEGPNGKITKSFGGRSSTVSLIWSELPAGEYTLISYPVPDGYIADPHTDLSFTVDRSKDLELSLDIKLIEDIGDATGIIINYRLEPSVKFSDFNEETRDQYDEQYYKELDQFRADIRNLSGNFTVSSPNNEVMSIPIDKVWGGHKIFENPQHGPYKLLSYPIPDGYMLYKDGYYGDIKLDIIDISPNKDYYKEIYDGINNILYSIDIPLIKISDASKPEVTPAPQTPAPDNITEVKDINLILSGNKVDLTLPVLNVNGRTMYPFRECLELMGAEVNWDPDARTANGQLGDKSVTFWIDSSAYVANGSPLQMDDGVTAFIRDGRTYIPLRYAAEALGYSVDWDGDTNTATLA